MDCKEAADRSAERSCLRNLGRSGRSSAWFRALRSGRRGRWFKSTRPDQLLGGRGAIAMFYLYILRSMRTGGLYVGHTQDLAQRFAEHQAGCGGQFTRGRGPWELAYREMHPDRASAVRRERFLKGVAGSREKKRLAGSGLV